MILFVGDQPSSRMSPHAKPFQGAACEQRLQSWIDTLGACPIYIVNQSEDGFLDMTYMFKRCGASVIALGNKASKALGTLPHFKLPHPSGRNRQINNKEFIAAKLAECKRYVNMTLNGNNVI